MSSLGHFKCYDIKQKLWLDLEGLEDGDAFRYLVVFDEVIYCVSSKTFTILFIICLFL